MCEISVLIAVAITLLVIGCLFGYATAARMEKKKHADEMLMIADRKVILTVSKVFPDQVHLHLTGGYGYFHLKENDYMVIPVLDASVKKEQSGGKKTQG